MGVVFLTEGINFMRPLFLCIWLHPVFFPAKHSATTLFRSREFLWQEGHTAFATKEEADEEVEVHIFAQFLYGSVVNYYYCGFGESIAKYDILRLF